MAITETILKSALIAEATQQQELLKLEKGWSTIHLLSEAQALILLFENHNGPEVER